MLKKLFTLFIFILNLSSHSTIKAEGNFVSFWHKIESKAREHAPELKIANDSYSESKANLYSQWALWGPKVDLNLSRAHREDPTFSTIPLIGTIKETDSSWQLSAAWPLYQRSVHYQVASAIRAKNLAAANHQLSQKSFEWKLKNVLGEYLLSVQQLASLETSIENAERNVHEAKTSIQIGQGTRLDLLRTQARLVLLQAKEAEFQQLRNLSLHHLLEFCGVEETEWDNLGGKSFANMKEDQAFQLIKEFFTTQGESFTDRDITAGVSFKQLSAEIEAETYQLNQYTLSEWPEVFLRATYGNQHPDTTHAIKDPNRASTFGLYIKIPLFSSGSIISSNLAQYLGERRKLAETELKKTQLKNQIGDDIQKSKALKIQLQAMSLGLSQFEEIFRLSSKSYKLGKIALSDLMTSQEDLFNAKSEWAKKQVEYSQILQKLKWQTGESL